MPTGGTCYRSTRNRPGGEPNRPRVLLAQSPVAAYLSGPPAQTPGAIPDADGAVAQLGERVNGIHEVRGSIPLGSTNKNIDLFQGIGRLMQSRPHCGERSLYHNYITEGQQGRCGRRKLALEPRAAVFRCATSAER